MIVALPNKPHRLLELALHDLVVVEHCPNDYKVDMDVWHRPEGGMCSVCLAGSVMAMTLHLKLDQPVFELDDLTTDDETQLKLIALNEFRIGNIKEGIQCIKSGMCDALHWQPVFARMIVLCPIKKAVVCDYDENRDKFMCDMHDMYDMLKQLYNQARKELQ